METRGTLFILYLFTLKRLYELSISESKKEKKIDIRSHEYLCIKQEKKKENLWSWVYKEEEKKRIYELELTKIPPKKEWTTLTCSSEKNSDEGYK